MKIEVSLSNDISTLIEYYEEVLKKNLHDLSTDSLSKQEDILEILKAFKVMKEASDLNT